MKRSLFAVLFVIAVAVWALVQAPAQRGLADFVPSGPLLYLEARDFGSLVRDWNGSPEKRLWLASANFEVFSRSRLYLRLAEVQKEFAAAAGFPPDMSLVEQIAGGESALALYDIGQLHFLYITRLVSARALESVLWRTHGKYESRNAAGMPFFVRTDPATRRVAAFATTNDYLLLATREDLIAGALTLLAGQPGATVKTERWYAESVRAAGPPGELRLIMNFSPLARSPYFRSYWVQRNVSQLRQYGAAISDIRRSPAEIREERVLLRFEPAAGAGNDAALAQALRLVPADAGFYSARVAPAVDDIIGLLERKILFPRPQAGPPSEFAPPVPISGGPAGSEADLETRIDEKPLENTAGRFNPAALRALIETAKPESVLQLHSSKVLPDGVFIGVDSAVVLPGSSDWDPLAVRTALASSIDSLLTTSGLGANWVERKAGAHTWYELDGLAHVAVAAEGRVLVIANSGDLIAAVLNRASTPPAAQQGTYAAGFRHAREGANFARLTALIDHPLGPPAPEAGPDARPPHFFSENMASFGRTLVRVESSSIVVRDTGPSVFQTVIYRLGK